LEDELDEVQESVPEYLEHGKDKGKGKAVIGAVGEIPFLCVDALNNPMKAFPVVETEMWVERFEPRVEVCSLGNYSPANY
jgi:hypothetical protein